MINAINALFSKLQAKYPEDEDLKLLQLLANIGPKDDLSSSIVIQI
jgi:hypothetical protein